MKKNFIEFVSENLDFYKYKFSKRVVPQISLRDCKVQLWAVDVGNIKGEKKGDYPTEYGFYDFPCNDEVTKYQKERKYGWVAKDIVTEGKGFVVSNLVRIWLPYLFAELDDNYKLDVYVDENSYRVCATCKVGASVRELELQKVTIKEKSSKETIIEPFYIFLPERGFNEYVLNTMTQNIYYHTTESEASAFIGIRKGLLYIVRNCAFDDLIIETEDVILNNANYDYVNGVSGII